MKVIDAFVFFNEYELADIRLNYLADTVDAFIITESNYTWNGQPNKKRFGKVYKNLPKHIQDKIIYKFVEHPAEYEGHFKVSERDTKNAQAHIAKENFMEDDLFLFSDLDEIWDKREIHKIKRFAEKNYWFFFKQQFRVVHVDWRARYGDIWYGTRGTKIKNLQGEYPILNDKITYKKSNVVINDPPPILPNGGWHLTYFGNVKERLTKLNSLVEIMHWENKTGKTHEQRANSVTLSQWNSSVGKKKVQGIQMFNHEVIDSMDINLLKVMQKHEVCFSGVFKTSKEYNYIRNEI